MVDDEDEYTVAIAGPIFLGILLNLGLYGVLVGQFSAYSLSHRRDNKKVKALIYSVFLLNTLQTVLLLRDGFVTFVNGFGNMDALMTSHLEWLSVPYITSLVGFIVQVFFAYRVFVAFGGSYFIPSVIFAASLTQGISGILAGTKDLKFRAYASLYHEAHIEIMVWHIAAAVCDILIAISMGYYLYRRDVVFHTRSFVSQAIRLSLETGTVTAIVTIVNLALFFGAPGKVYFLVPSFISAKLYGNTVLVVFNNKAQFVTGVCDIQDCITPLSALRFKKPEQPWDERRFTSTTVEVHVARHSY